MKHRLTIKPAIPVVVRHKVEDALRTLGYTVIGGGTHADTSSCDISFDSDDRKDVEAKYNIKSKTRSGRGNEE